MAGTWRRHEVALLAFVVSVGWLVVATHPVRAATENVTITATVVEENPYIPNPTVQFSGLAAASASVMVSRNGTLVATQTATSGGNFSITLSDEPVGQIAYLISATDLAGAALAPVTFALNLALGTNTIVSGVFLGPSIAVDRTSVKLGQFVTVSGSTVPNSAVTVSVNSVQAYSYTVTADGQGQWSKLVNTQEVGVGTHTASARSVYGGSQVSAESATVSFAVNPLEQCDGKKSADLNCDGRVNLTDFSILLYFWQQTTPSNSRADINANGRVDVVDFSIMLYQWTA